VSSTDFAEAGSGWVPTNPGLSGVWADGLSGYQKEDNNYVGPVYNGWNRRTKNSSMKVSALAVTGAGQFDSTAIEFSGFPDWYPESSIGSFVEIPDSARNTTVTISAQPVGYVNGTEFRGPTEYGSISIGGTKINREKYPDAWQYVLGSGGLTSQASIAGEIGPEWVVPTYEPQRSKFLKDVGVDPDGKTGKAKSIFI